MIRALAVLLLLCAPAAAQGTDCGRATTAAERAICADPALRAVDGQMGKLFAELRKAATPAVRTRLVEGQRAWLKQRDCTGTCLADKLRERRDALLALAARIGDDGTVPRDLRAAWLTGVFRTGTVGGLGGLVPAEDAPWLPDAGTEYELRAGAICYDGGCRDFGLEPQRLTDGPGREGLPALLQLPAGTPYLLTYFGGRAEYALVVAPSGAVLAVANACAASGAPCGWVRQDWVAVRGGSLHEVDLGKP